MSDVTVNAKPGDTIHLDVHVDDTSSASEAASAAPDVENASLPELHAAVIAADGRRGTIASRRRADGAVRLQIGDRLTEWMAGEEVRPT